MSEREPESVLWNLMRGALATRAVAVVSELRVADALADGRRPVEEVARDVGADPDTLHRLLRALASEGVFAEEERGVFHNTPASELLRRGGWDDFAHFFGGIWYRTVAELDARTRAAVFPRIFGDDFWGWLAVNPSERASFDRAMMQRRRRGPRRAARGARLARRRDRSRCRRRQRRPLERPPRPGSGPVRDRLRPSGDAPRRGDL